jgi:nitrate/nitrite-specific signal transduction histidine kinase
VILRDQGFAPAVQALAERLSVPGRTRIQLELEEDDLSERAGVVLYQIVREALHGALARSSVSQITVRVGPGPDDGVEAVVADDGAGERRRGSFDAIAERARTLNGELTIDSGDDGGTTVRVVLPAYTARR